MTESSARRAVIACAIIAVVGAMAVMAIASMRVRERAAERYDGGRP